eukprot:TRINITY_DN2233_c0_g1_i4.p2 TRINITY_DN2233_c0_g1~~TRINITY_DN2233_c0_g1_i4.p2  ORF type:complete len:155 (-),score=15.63 TRINITY_DN2233_c0_g1_i4:14-478(-)
MSQLEKEHQKKINDLQKQQLQLLDLYGQVMNQMAKSSSTPLQTPTTSQEKQQQRIDIIEGAINQRDRIQHRIYRLRDGQSIQDIKNIEQYGGIQKIESCTQSTPPFYYNNEVLQQPPEEALEEKMQNLQVAKSDQRVVKCNMSCAQIAIIICTA